MPNILNAPTFKLTDRAAILERILQALQSDSLCRWDFKGSYRKLTEDEEANWDARTTVARLLFTFPASATADVEPKHVEPVEQSAE